MPPLRNGIADYVAAMLPGLAEHREVHVFTEYDEAVVAPPGVQVHPYRDFEWMDARAPFAAVMYHVGNNVCHGFMMNCLYVHPGIVVLHDWNLHRFLAYCHLRKGDQRAYIDEMVYCHGERGRQAAHLTIRGFYAEMLFHLYPMNRLVIESAACVAVHNRWTARRIGLDQPGAEVRVVPFYSSRPVAAMEDVRGVREKYTLEAGFTLGAFGMVTSYKGFRELFQALAVLRQRGVPARLLVVGALDNADALRAQCREQQVEELVTFTGYVSKSELWALMNGVDVGVNLRYPTQGETSACLRELMSCGRAVIIPDYRQFREYPADSCVRVPLGRPLVGALVDVLERLAADPDARRVLGERARRYVRERDAPASVVEAYEGLFHDYPRRRRPGSLLGRPGLPHLSDVRAWTAAHIRRESVLVAGDPDVPEDLLEELLLVEEKK